MAEDLILDDTCDILGYRIELKTTTDRIKAFIKIEEHPTDPISVYSKNKFEHDLCEWLETKLAVELVDSRALKMAIASIEQKSLGIDRKIAEGKPPGEPRDGKIIFLVQQLTKNFTGEYHLNDKYQKRFDTIKVGDVVLRIYPPHTGETGLDINKKTLPGLNGKEASVNIGEGLEILENKDKAYKEVRSKVDGYLKQEGSMIVATEILSISGDIDHKSGSIIFNSKCEISGDIKSGFSVKSDKGILIKGDVHNAILESKFGNIEIKGKVIGFDTVSHLDPSRLESDSFTRIQCEGNFEASSVESQAIYSKNDIKIAGNVARCLLSSGSSIHIGGALFASRVRTVCGIDIAILGNDSEAPVLIEILGADEASREFLIANERLNAIIEQIESLTIFLGPLIANPSKLKSLQLQHKVKAEAALKKLIKLEEDKKLIEKEISIIVAESRHSQETRINIQKIAYPGTIIRAKDKEYLVSKIENGPFAIVYSAATETFERTTVKPLACTF